jgi:hypothetical protein
MSIAISDVSGAARRWTCATLVPACPGRRISSGFVQNAAAISGRPIRRRLRPNQSQRPSHPRKHMPTSAISALGLDDEIDDDPEEDDDFDEDDEDSDDNEDDDDEEGDVETWQVAPGPKSAKRQPWLDFPGMNCLDWRNFPTQLSWDASAGVHPDTVALADARTG